METRRRLTVGVAQKAGPRCRRVCGGWRHPPHTPAFSPTGSGRRWPSAGDPVRAEAQQRYMKSAHALPRAHVPRSSRRCCRPLLAAYEPASRGVMGVDGAVDLWDGATHREEWYAACAVARHRRPGPGSTRSRCRSGGTWSSTGAWWDVVDETATHLVRDTLAGHPDAVTPVIDAWSVDDDLVAAPDLRASARSAAARRPTATSCCARSRPTSTTASFWLRLKADSGTRGASALPALRADRSRRSVRCSTAFVARAGPEPALGPVDGARRARHWIGLALVELVRVVTSRATIGAIAGLTISHVNKPLTLRVARVPRRLLSKPRA